MWERRRECCGGGEGKGWLWEGGGVVAMGSVGRGGWGGGRGGEGRRSGGGEVLCGCVDCGCDRKKVGGSEEGWGKVVGGVEA